LFAITSSAEFLKDTNLHPDQAEEVSSICDSSLLMLRLVNDVLDLSKLDSGKLELESREFDLHSLLKRLGENMSRQVDRKHKRAVRMNFEMTQDVPKVIIGDSCRILQVCVDALNVTALVDCDLRPTGAFLSDCL
jgi:two-component system sensor histidine kinase/response regulator